MVIKQTGNPHISSVSRRHFLSGMSALFLTTGSSISFPVLAKILESQSNKLPNLNDAQYLFKLERVGTSAGNVVQAFAIDDRNKVLYTQRVGGKKNSQAFLNRFDFHTSATTKVADSVMNCNKILGHQGLTVETRSAKVKLWGSAGTSVPNAGRCAVRFDYVANGSLIDYETFVLFGQEFQAKGSITPCISADQKYLVARGRSQTTGQSILRVWDLSIFTGSGDYSERYLYQFGTDMMSVTQSDIYPLQGIACDGSVIVCQYGFAEPNVNKALLVYSLDGKLLAKNMDCTIGKERALTDGNGDHWEPEGIQFALNQQGKCVLYHCINSGTAGKRVVRLYVS